MGQALSEPPESGPPRLMATLRSRGRPGVIDWMVTYHSSQSKRCILVTGCYDDHKLEVWNLNSSRQVR
jgi:hypothetical protein